MSAPARRDLRARRTPRTAWRFLIAQAAVLLLVISVGALAAWPIYRSAAFVIVVVAAMLAGTALAAAGLRWRLNGWWLALATIATYVVLGLPLAAPGSLGSVSQALQGLRGVVTAPVTGWKDLLTLELPLGSYQATLAPAFLVFLAATVLALSIAWRGGRWWPLAVVTTLLPTVFGIAFGATAPMPGLSVGPVSLSREALVGMAALVMALVAIVWRTTADRRRAIAAATAATGVRSGNRPIRGLAGRAATAAGMVAVGLVAATVVAPWALAGTSRDVLRAEVDPRLEIAAELSPLGQYRTWFGDDRFDQTMFRVAAPAGVDRVRLATLPYYDGRSARVVDPAAAPGDARSSFTRVPSALPADPGSAAGAGRIVIEGWNEVWMPTLGAVTSVDFDGSDAATLADGFYYNAETAAGVQLAPPGLAPGAEYRQGTAYREDPPTLGSLEPARSGPTLGEDVVPETLVRWVDEHASGSGGAGLEQLVELLRARGFLSHALTIDPAAPPAWTAELGDYAFQPSRAGHSTDRIDQLFADLLAREDEVGGDDDAALVAAVGDDEQFAVAAMMIADRLGFDARIVVGARLDSTDDTLTTCDEGVCAAGDVSAWLEVRGVGPEWVAVDVTPQHAVFPSPDTQQRQDPKIPTDVRQEQAETVQPADANPSDGGRSPNDDSATTQDLTALWTALRIGGVSLLVLLLLFGPFALIVLVKLARRRGRRTSTDPVARFTGGWQEFVDSAVDHGLPGPGSRTRHELVTAYGGSAGAAELATLADRSVFDVAPPDEDDADRFWRIVESERSRLDEGLSFWARLRARVSLRSLMRRERRISRAQRLPRSRRDR
ncbi:transglutaminase domain-containing protein [Microbacterium sp. NE2HP2]|uniref:transglutaminase domain-containing protein n=1 Tax=Microbacterium plantarum TaxID=1816425 RepID=UPI002365210C|nr:transglutaminase domain-containing protein [Microbacterium plantarum]MDD7946021.1 transglutaminase domain-containing protein [Microbacterium plantarum]